MTTIHHSEGITESELAKIFNPQEVEAKWYKRWKESKQFRPRAGKQKKAYTIIMPPPNVTGKLHMGHALDNTIQDALIRYKRMCGFETNWIPGQDHAGIATQAVVEKALWDEQKISRHELGREKFLELIWQWKEKHGHLIIEQLEKIGVSCNWDEFVFTMDPLPNRAVKKTFVDWYNQGLIYQADYIINWDPALQSAISDAEVEHKEIQGAFYHIAYRLKTPLAGGPDHLVVATTRPETLLGDTAVAVHPQDPRFAHLIGQTIIVPIIEREVPIIGDEHVDREKGTGCLKVTPGHDFNDFEIGRRHKLPIVNILNRDGTLNNVCPRYQGLSCAQARTKILAELTEREQFLKQEACVHQVGHSERSGMVIEPMISKQWFVKSADLAARAVAAVTNNEMTFYPKSWENTYFAWLNNPKDWCISRQLWWGHRIPVFSCTTCNHQWASEEQEQQCPKCHQSTITQDPDVLDTWFSSGLWAMSTLGWPDPELMKQKGFEKYFPTATLVTGFDIIFFWVARMMMMTLNMTGQVPFHHTYIHAIVRDKHGRKMSKSLGNGIDPLELIAQYGADALRFSLASGSGHNRNLNLDPDRIEGHRNFINKIWNAYRFIHPFLKEATQEFSPALLDHHDRWILAELNTLTQEVHASMAEYRFDDTCKALYAFVYDKFCSWYIELSKKVLYGDDQQRKANRASILKFIFKKILALLHPFCPFITEELWSSIKDPSDALLIASEYPEYSPVHYYPQDQEKMNKFIEVIVAIRALRQSINLKPQELVAVQLHTDAADLSHYFLENLNSFQDLAKVDRLTIHLKSEPRLKKSISKATDHTEIYLPLEGLVDIGEQIQKLEKSIAATSKEFEGLDKKLHNASFMDRAPLEVVTEVRTKHQLASEKLASLKIMLANFS